MIRNILLSAFLMALAVAVSAAPAHAQATRTWVSGVGDDANPCSRTAPCKTFAGAIAKTVAGGEIDALDPAGFGALTITKPIILDGGGGQVASVLVAGTNGITVAAGSGDTVILRNLRINGLMCSTPAAANCTGSPGLTGISFISGRVLSIENCVIFSFSTSGINASVSANATLNVLNTTITNIGTCSPGSCSSGQGAGIFLTASSGSLVGEMDHSTIQKISNTGIQTGGGSVIFTVTNSNILNAAGVGVLSGASGTVLGVDSSSVSSNNTAFQTNGGFIRISRNVIYDNNTNYTISGGTIATTGDNVAAVNGATVPNGTVAHQ